MISSIHNRLFGPGGCLTSLAIRSYIDGSLTPAGKILVEEHIKKCRLCAEAMKGFKKHGRSRFIQNDVEFLSKKIRRRYTGLNNQPFKWPHILILSSLAAFLVLLLGIFYIFRQNIADQKIREQHRPDSIVNDGRTLPDSAKVSPPHASGDKELKH